MRKPKPAIRHLRSEISNLKFLLIATLATLGLIALADEATMLACSGKITALTTNTPRLITATVKIADGTTNLVFTVTDNTKFSTSGIGVYGDLKTGDNLQIEYKEKEGGTNEADRISVRNAYTAPAKPATKPAAKKPAPKPAPKKAPAKKK